MAAVHFHLAFAVAVIASLSTSTSCELVESIVSTRRNYLLKSHLMERLQITNSLSCTHRCLSKAVISFLKMIFKLLSKSQGVCELSSKAAGYFDDSLSEEAGWLYGQIARIAKRFFSENDVAGMY